MRLAISTCMLLLATGAVAQAQTTAPAQTKEPSQKSMVVNPTQAQCSKGWSSNLKWTKTQFDQFCATLKKSK